MVMNPKIHCLRVIVFSGMLVFTHASANDSLWKTHMAAANKASQGGRHADAEKSSTIKFNGS